METEMHVIPEMTIEEFAKKHGLVMEIHERRRSIGDPARFYAHFKQVEVSEGRILSSVSGDGATPDDAVLNYANAISLKPLVVGAYTASRREIDAPRLKSMTQAAPMTQQPNTTPRENP